jgi:hypothetical protein
MVLSEGMALSAEGLPLASLSFAMDLQGPPGLDPQERTAGS